MADIRVDTAVTEAAEEEFKEVESYFKKRIQNSSIALEHYKKAIELYPNYYNTNLYAGDMYWYLE